MIPTPLIGCFYNRVINIIALKKIGVSKCEKK